MKKLFVLATALIVIALPPICNSAIAEPNTIKSDTRIPVNFNQGVSEDKSLQMGNTFNLSNSQPLGFDVYTAYKNESLPLINASNNPPYSEAVRYKDEFTGVPYAGVFDNSFNPSLFGTTTGLLTSWGTNPTSAFVRVMLYAKTSNPCGLFDCSRSGTLVKFDSLEVKAGDKAFSATEKSPKGSFILTQEQVQILLNAPENENAKVRLTDNEGKVYIYEIGTGTVKAWKIVYAPAK